MGSMADQLDFSNMTEQEIEFHYFTYVYTVREILLSNVTEYFLRYGNV